MSRARTVRCCVITGVLLGAWPVTASGAVVDPWLAGLQQRVAHDLKAGRPLVVHASVALCDNRIIRCGNRRLGDGDSLRTNLYWATRGGVRGWLDRRHSGWTRVFVGRGDRPAILERVVYHRQVRPDGAWRALGVTKPFDLYLIADGWRGRSIRRAMEAYTADLYGMKARPVRLPGGLVLQGGAAAHVVAYVGHNGWMDIPPPVWPTPRGPRQARGTIAIACHTMAYLARDIPAASRVPLVMTRDFVFAGTHALDGAVLAFAQGAGLTEIRLGAAQGYATGQGKPLRRVAGTFTNPSHRRWRGRRWSPTSPPAVSATGSAPGARVSGAGSGG